MVEEKTTQIEEVKKETKTDKISSENKVSEGKKPSSLSSNNEGQEKVTKTEEKRKEKEDRIGILNIYTTFNNTLMNLTDLAGNTIARFSGGESTKQSRLKANPTIAMFVAQKIAEEARDKGITGFYIRIRAETGENNPGPGAHTAIKSLTRAGFKIISIIDTTKMPRGGPKKQGGRRGRRV